MKATCLESRPFFSSFRRGLMASACAVGLAAGAVNVAAGAAPANSPTVNAQPPVQQQSPAEPPRVEPVRREPESPSPRRESPSGQSTAPLPGNPTPAPLQPPNGNGTGSGSGTGSGTGNPIHHEPGHLVPLPPIQPNPTKPVQANNPNYPFVLPWWMVNGWGLDSYWSDLNNDNGGGNANQDQPAIPPMLPPAAAQPSAQAVMAAAQATMDQVRVIAQARLQASTAWQMATATVARATTEIDTASAQAKDSLVKNKEYAALLQRHWKIEDQIGNIQRTVQDPSPAQLTPLATLDMQTNAALRKMETDLTAKDPAVIDAKRRLADAQAAVDAMKKNLDVEVMSDPTWQAAHQQFDAARQRVAMGN